MERILAQLGDVATKVSTLEEKRRKLASFLREIKAAQVETDDEIIENKMVVGVTKDPLRNVRVIGVDGGLVKHPYHAVDLILTRAIAVIFDYRDGRLSNVNYYPDPLAPPRLAVITDPYSETDFAHSADLERALTEVTVQKQVLQQNPTILLADGQIVPHPSNRPQKSSPAWPAYERLIKAYRDVYSAPCFYAGVVEDSRSTRFSGLIAEKILNRLNAPKELVDILTHTRDTNLLTHVLKPGERSFVFRYGNAKNPIMEDLGPDGKNIYSFYLRTAEFDRPIRIDFYARENPTQVADSIAALVLPLSSENAEYGIPAVIIEADARAKLREEELETIHTYIVDQVGDLPSLYKLRRENRPF